MSEVAVLSRPNIEATTAGSILIIDDEAAIRESLETLLEFALPDRNGLEILTEIRDRDPQLAVIMITAYGTVDNAVRAMQNGANNFIQKPWDNEKLLADV